MIIRLPENKDLIVDSKVSLTDYLAYCSATDDATRKAALKKHAASVSKHIKQLGKKRYQDLPEIQTLDFVILFVPVESALHEALRERPGLYEEALKYNITLTAPSTLLGMLSTVKSIWRLDAQNRNAQQIAERAGKLYDKFAGFIEDIDGIGKRIDQTRTAYDKARGKLHTGPGNLIRQAEMLKKLGAKSSKALPNDLLEQSGGTLPAPPSAVDESDPVN